VIAASVTECDGALPIQRPRGTVRLKARADRLDRFGSGELGILDYKTGTLPTEGAITDGTAPQLPLEAAIAIRGGFAGLPAAPVRSLVYWRLTGGQEAGEVKPVQTEAAEIQDLSDRALESLAALVDAFLLGTRAFIARPHPARAPRGGDYDHLSRVAEWSEAEEGE
jgi:ATP-dependent helicase/nuclease subunit B